MTDSKGTTMSIRVLAVGTALVAGLSLTACSSSSGGTAASAPHLPATAGTQGRATSGTFTPSAPVVTNGAPAGGGSGGAFCQELTGVAPSLEDLSGLHGSDRQAYLAKLQALVAAAPAAIKPDVQVLEQIDEQIVNGNPQADDQFDTPEMATHMQHFLAWMQSNCPGVLKDVPTTLP